MINSNNFFVKLNCKNINNIKSLIINNEDKYLGKGKDKYIMCSGRYDKNGWTFVFRAKSYEEAEQLANLSFIKYKKTDLKQCSF